MKNSSLADDGQLTITNYWTQFNSLKTNKLLHEFKKTLVIYSYSISKNFLKEVFLKANVKFTLTNDLQKASVIIGLTKHLQQNSKLNQFANEKKIPVYSVFLIKVEFSVIVETNG